MRRGCWFETSTTCGVSSGAFAPELLATDYGKEIWALYQSGALHPEVALTGQFEDDDSAADLEGVMREIDDARLEEAARQLRMMEAE